ncbi:MAG: DUF4215 domain-containing protein [Myxococcales bacterium]|nr:DUF4215 domain-containing protein [Myxococcales bacterium]
MDQCPQEGLCTFKKPNFLILMDYSTSMNADFGLGQTRWEAAEDAVKNLATTKFNNENMHLALMRFGHDPSAALGTTIPMDTSNPPLTDGQALDVFWYDPQGNDKSFYECNGQALVDALDNDVPAPLGGQEDGIGTWTKGALDQAKALIAQSKADHPGDMDERFYANLVMTDGAWTSMDGNTVLGPAGENPAITAADLWDNQGIPTYVVYFGDPNDAPAKGAANMLASAGGTASINAANQMELDQALKDVISDIKDDVVQPLCAPGLPRFMVLLDASSSMLNVNLGMMAGQMGETGWDQVRAALAGDLSIFDVVVNGNKYAEDLVHFGLAVFGHNQPNPGEQKILVDYGPCHKSHFDWALNPETSCGIGCDDPWGGPPITWTFLNSDNEGKPPPLFADTTISHMPQCQGMTFCTGSGTYTHLGLQLIKNNQVAYHNMASTDPKFPYPANANTLYANILITDGQYSGYSTDNQVQAELTQMYNKGIVTYVIGFGDGVDTPQAVTQLNKMADWGSGNLLDYYDANNQMELENAFKMILEGVALDPCCAFTDCTFFDPFTPNECDPNDPATCLDNQECVKDENDEWYVCQDVMGPVCGDGILDEGEECDDGNLIDGDGCSPFCVFSDGCGNGKIDGGEECDDGNQIDDDACTNACKDPACGDGIVQAGEECDDGNLVDDDLCSNQCIAVDPAPQCGNGEIDRGEECDDANDSNNDACTTECKAATCGDGLVWAGVEACDDGNQVDDDTCTNLCALPGCGDGVLVAGEACDDGNLVDGDGCDHICAREPGGSCGDGIVQAGEACDDANLVDDDDCTNLCALPICGDGIVQADEACDDANELDDDECRNDCSLPGGDTGAGEGCGCVAGDPRGGGLVELLLAWGLAGWRRRRRRAPAA